MEKVIITVVRIALRAISPQLRTVLRSGIDKLEEAAKATPNEWDDLLVWVLNALLGYED